MSALAVKITAVICQLLAGGILIQSPQPLWPFFQIGNFIESSLLLIPYWGIKAIITVFFVSLAIIPFFFSREYIFKGADDQSAWRDLRYWALAAAVTEILVYLYF